MSQEKQDGKERPPIPILRTYEGDVHKVTRTQDGEDLRKILVREMEEKKKAQEEYKKKARDLAKESLLLKDRRRGFLKRRGADDKEKITDDIDRKYIDDTVSGAVAYMESAQRRAGSRSSADHPHVSSNADSPRAEPSGPVTVKKSADSRATRDSQRANSPEVLRENLGAGIVRPPNVTFPDDPGDAAVVQSEGRRAGVLGWFRGKRSEKRIDQKKREALQKKQQEVVEKESIRKAWKDYSTKKESLRQSGLEARDVRSYDADPSANTTIQKQNIIAVVFVFVILSIMVFVVVSVSLSDDDSTVTALPEESLPDPDVISNDDTVFVDLSTSREDWIGISRGRVRKHIVTKFVPYTIEGTDRFQVDLSQFFRLFSMQVPVGLRDSLGDYYFVGNYTDKTSPHGIFIASVRTYSDAIVWMLDWERQAINAFANVFPGLLRESGPELVSAQSEVVGNKDVRILKNPNSENELVYYFFNRSILVFIVGNRDIVVEANKRIRLSNSL